MASRQGEFDERAGEALRRIRKERGMSQEAAAAEGDVDQSMLSKAERLGPQVMSWGRLRSLADALDVDIEIVFHPRRPPSKV